MRVAAIYTPQGALTAIVLLTYLGAAYARTCERHQFWSAFFNKCMNCTECIHPDIVITPCQGHRDTICGPLSDLKIDWSWMRRGADHKKNREKEMTETFKENMQEIKLHEMHVKQKEKMLRRLQKHRLESPEHEIEDASSLLTPSNQRLWKQLADEEFQNKQITEEIIKNLRRPKPNSENQKIFEIPQDKLLQSLHFNSNEAKELLKSAAKYDEDDEEESEKEDKTISPHEKAVKNFGFFPVDVDDSDYDNEQNIEDQNMDVSEKVMDFSTTERMVLDYQAGVLYLALASIVIFFLAALCYSLKHLRTWGNYNYREDLEDLKSWIWTQSHKNDGKMMPSTIYKSTTEVVSKQNGNCKYLERIITKNAKRKMNRVPQNVYQGAEPSIETRPLTASTDELDIHKPTCV